MKAEKFKQKKIKHIAFFAQSLCSIIYSYFYELNILDSKSGCNELDLKWYIEFATPFLFSLCNNNPSAIQKL